ncbi:exonuclease YqaJ [Pandoravirus japonicus]|uniref:Exonuclease YqaJ n=1 Tax=Pandoravirus japonicus TaxID=2823154 RepID=A0A811BNH3_9VIRU|nr:exonuclease YqaJ [Pandoravirus japonicus]
MDDGSSRRACENGSVAPSADAGRARDGVAASIFPHTSDTQQRARDDDDDEIGIGIDDAMATAAQWWPRPIAQAVPTVPGRQRRREGATDNADDDDDDDEARRGDNTVTDDEKRAFLDRLAMTPAQIDEAENTPQRTEAWFGFRRDRLSASLFGGAAGHNKHETEEGVLKKMLWSSPFSNAATEYGTALEGAAFAAVQAAVASALQQRGYGTVWFEETGTRVFAEHPWLCASADGLVRAVDGPGGATLAGVLELKCPYYRKAFYEPTPHYYYDQFSGQARIHNADFIVFGVYTPEATQINYFQRDAAYWDDVLFPALRAFYMEKYLWRAILRDRGRITHPNIDPHACIHISRLDFKNHERVEAQWAERAARAEAARRDEQAVAEERRALLAAAAAAVPDPWEPVGVDAAPGAHAVAPDDAR